MNIFEAVDSGIAREVWTKTCHQKRVAAVYEWNGKLWWTTHSFRRWVTPGRWAVHPRMAQQLDDPVDPWEAQLVQCPKCSTGFLFLECKPGRMMVFPLKGCLTSISTGDGDEIEAGQATTVWPLEGAVVEAAVGGLVVVVLGKPVNGEMAP